MGREGAGDACGCCGLGVKLPDALVERVSDAHMEDLLAINGIDAGPTVEILHCILCGDEFVGRDQRESQIVFDEAEAESHKVRDDGAGYSGHPF